MTNNNSWLRWLWPLAFVGVIAVGAYWVVGAIQLTRNTGLLQVNLSYKNVPISVGASGKAPQFIGKDSPIVRLQPGTYTVAATVSGNEIVNQARVVAGQTTKVTLDPASAIKIPSADDVNFSGLDALLNIGLTDNQVSAFKYQAFSIKPSAKNIVIDTNSVVTAPYNPETDLSFGVSFDFNIDSAAYHAKLTYQGLSDLGVTIKNSNGRTVVSVADKSPF